MPYYHHLGMAHSVNQPQRIPHYIQTSERIKISIVVTIPTGCSTIAPLIREPLHDSLLQPVEP